MQEVEDKILEESFFQKSISSFKTNRTLQITSIFVSLILISIPVYSIYSKYNNSDDEYQRDLLYVIGGEWGGISWISQNDLELSDDEVFTLTLTNEDFPDEAKNMNIVALYIRIDIYDYANDNEETNGVGCAIDSGEDAYDSISGIVSTPNNEPLDFEYNSSFHLYPQLFELPEDVMGGFGSPGFITGYTVKEIEKMFQNGDNIVGEYNFEFIGNVESGDSTFQCERQDSSITIDYYIGLDWWDVEVIESDDDFW
tara:strand:+ start:51 stop:815 length:765 start_codon:yes stop_codon:yes gene_type:complete